jgi:hypothetical protein
MEVVPVGTKGLQPGDKAVFLPLMCMMIRKFLYLQPYETVTDYVFHVFVKMK